MSDDNDPWKRHKKRSEEGAPPNIDEIFGKLLKKLGQLEKAQGLKRQGKGEDAGNGNGGSLTPAVVGGSFGIGLIVTILFLIWLLSGIFIISPAEQGVILRFGRYQKTVGPGPHWIPRLVKSVKVVNVQRISTFSYEADMLTKDENIVFVSLSVQFRIDEPRLFLFNVVNPVSSLQQATASTLRQVVGNNSLDEVLTTGRARIRNEVEQQLAAVLKPYQTGLLITDVNIQPARPPQEVTGAFDDAIKAREDEQRYINGARAYAEKVVLLAEGRASRTVREAMAFKEQVAFKAKADIAAYLALLPEYKRSPLVTKQRLYLETLESVLAHSNKVLVDEKGGNNLLYLPIDKLISASKKTLASNHEPLTMMPVTSPSVDQPSSRPPLAARSGIGGQSPNLKKRLSYSDNLVE